MSKRLVLAAVILGVSGSLAQAQPARRPLTLADHSRIKAVGDPQRSPDGLWVAYTVTTIDAEKDRRNTDIWMVKWDGSEQLQLTSSPDGESSPRWSPDNKYLAFVASRGTEEEKKKGGQIWLLNRAGGEAQQASATSRAASRHPVVARQHPHRVHRRRSTIPPTSPRRWTAGSARPRRRS